MRGEAYVFLVLSLYLLSTVRAYAQKTAQDIAAELGPSVVLIVGEVPPGSIGLGTGFLVAPDLIATNFHVVEGTDKIYVKLPNGTLLESDTLLAYDSERDLALIKLPERQTNQPVTLGNSSDIKQGQEIVVISNPRGILENTVSNGLVSAVRHLPTYTLFQISAPISLGSSGGPVFNLEGEVVAVVVGTIEEGQNLNFAVPASYLKELLVELHETKLSALPRHSAPVAPARKPKPCPSPVYIVGINLDDGTRGVGWLTKNMTKWWEEEAKKKYSVVCFVEDESSADYRLEWRSSSYSVPMYNQETGTPMGSWGHADVRVTVYRAGSQQLLFTNSHHGRWRWSKPDKDSFRDGIKFIAD